MDNAQKTGLREAKAVLIWGPKRPLPLEIKQLYDNNPDACLIGDGNEQGINIADIQSALEKRNLYWGSNTRGDINAHGKIDLASTRHMIGMKGQSRGFRGYTGEFLQSIKQELLLQENDELYVHLWSCKSGAVEQEIKNLRNSTIINHAELRASLHETSVSGMISSLKRHFANNLSPAQQYILDIPQNYISTFSKNDNGYKMRYRNHITFNDTNIATITKTISAAKDISSFTNTYLGQQYKRFSQSLGQEVDSKLLNEQESEHYILGMLEHISGSKGLSVEKQEEFVTTLKEKGVNINSPLNGVPPLISAVTHGNYNMTQILLAQGADASAADKNKYTSLHYAAKFTTDKEIVNTLLKFDALLSTYKDTDGCIALHYAAHKGNNEVINCILEQNIDLVNIQDDYGFSPMHFASEAGREATVITLLNYGADYNIKDNYDKTPLDIARENNREKVVQIIELFAKQEVVPSKKSFVDRLIAERSSNSTGSKALSK